VSESPRYGEPASGGQPASSQSSGDRPPGRPRSSDEPRSGGQAGRRADPVADFQRWLMRAGARSMASQVAEQVKRTIGQDRRSGADVWDTATNEPPPTEPPECQWCPICQAARAARGSGPGLGARLADVGGVLGTVVQDAFTAFEQVLKVPDQNPSAERPRVPARPAGQADRGEDGR
jgi:hypothetical protein